MIFQKLENNCPSPRSYNPTGCKVGDKNYLLFRCESCPLDADDDDWWFSTCSYWLEAYDDDFKPTGEYGPVKFIIGNDSYTEINRPDITKERFCFEDIRIIHGTENNGCCLATVSACRETYVDIKVGVCSINLFERTVELLHYIDIGSQLDIEKNWAVIFSEGQYHCMYSYYPMVTSSSDDLNTIFFDKADFPDELLFRISCQPLQLPSGEYVMLVHKRLGSIWGYYFYVTKLRINDNKIERLGRPQEIDVPCGKPERVGRPRMIVENGNYCSSLLETKNGIAVLAGVTDKTSAYAYLKLPETVKVPVFKFKKP